jgi:hypothetical protein
VTTDEAVAALNNLGHGRSEGDPEDFHSDADAILLQVVPPEVALAYYDLVERSAWWACA